MSQLLKIKVLKPGVHTSVQDQGREKFRAFGVPKSGPMDVEAASLANFLVGNPADHPVIEFTFQGPVLKMEGKGIIAITGAPFKVSLDQKQVQLNASIPLQGDHLLKISGTPTGCRGYLALAGDWQIDHWLDSCSTAPQAPSQVTPGSLIIQGLEISVIGREKEATHLIKQPELRTLDRIRVLPGPEYSKFSVAVIKEFLRNKFMVSNQSNRMGYRLDSSLKQYKTPIEIISSGVVPGTIQVTHSGQLIVLMADAQTTGGYPRIANVITKDLDKLAQLKPGDQFGFQLVSLNEAYHALEL
jgi:antagonist of KipI